MQIRDISPVRYSQVGDICVFEVDYSAVFTQPEVNSHFVFADSVRVREEDDTSADDVVLDWLPAETWTPDDTIDRWTWTVRVHKDDVDTELGGEEIYLQIALANASLSSPAIVANTAIINVSPS